MQYAAVPPKRSIERTENRNRTERSYNIRFKQRMKIYDAITFQHVQAANDPHLNHCFLTATFRAGNVPANPNNVFSDFCERIRKAGFLNYVWTRELTKLGTVHYHFTTVGPKRPINSKSGWSINQCWSECRKDYSPNAIRSSTIFFCRNCGARAVTNKKPCCNQINFKPVNQMVINSIDNARGYVAKYISKMGSFDEKSKKFVCYDQSRIGGRIYAVSNDLIKPPLDYPQALDLCYMPYYSDGKDVRKYDFSSVGGIKYKLAPQVYSEIEKLLIRKAKNNAVRPQKKSSYRWSDQGILSV